MTKDHFIQSSLSWFASVRLHIERHGPSDEYPRNFPVPNGLLLTLELGWQQYNEHNEWNPTEESAHG